ncbi:MAG: class I SAM-dependent methyltransferase [Actinobacteria bacterium]|nr:class I SAM-dependent methyltransferase [Actinomycetota bacterium]
MTPGDDVVEGDGPDDDAADADAAAAAAERRRWTIGDYPAVARRLAPVSTAVVDAVERAVGPIAGRDVLDVGVGDGNAAIEAARRGARVAAVDLTPAQVERARARIGAERLDIDVRLGDAQALPWPTASFDAVVSVFALIFAPAPALAAAESARVCRPGGVVALTAWAGGPWRRAWQPRAAEVNPMPPPAGADSDDWGDPATAGARLRAAGLEPHVEVRPFAWSFPSVEAGVEFFLTAAGPFVAFREAAAARGRAADAEAAVGDALREANEATDGTVSAPAPYLLALGRIPEEGGPRAGA